MKHGLAAMLLALAAGGLAAQEKPAGAALYATHCVACHQADGQGAPGIAPPLAGNLARHASSGGGRDYLARVPLTGMVGAITVNGVRYTGNMPSFAALSDGEIAAVVAYVLQEFNGTASADWLNAEFVAQVRKQGGTPNDTHRARGRLAAAGS